MWVLLLVSRGVNTRGKLERQKKEDLQLKEGVTSFNGNYQDCM